MKLARNFDVKIKFFGTKWSIKYPSTSIQKSPDELVLKAALYSFVKLDH